MRFILLTIFALYSTLAFADNPLDYPPFKWYPLLPPAKVEAKNSTSNPAKPDIYQNKDKTKQWYEGDFIGLDDD